MERLLWVRKSQDIKGQGDGNWQTYEVQTFVSVGSTPTPATMYEMRNHILSYGTLVYGPSKRVSVVVDQNIVDYYRSLIPKAKHVNPQKYPAHITVVRKYEYDDVNMDEWEFMAGSTVSFVYCATIFFSNPYYNLDAHSNTIGLIRRRLGLPTFRAGYNCYHISLGNVK